MPSDGPDVVLEDRAELFGTVVAGREPGRQLVVPDERVPADDLAVGLGVGDERIRRRPVVHAGRRVEGLPLHDILGRHAGELRVDYVAVFAAFRQQVRVHGDAELDVSLIGEAAQSVVTDGGQVL